MSRFYSTTKILNNVYSGGTLNTLQSMGEVFNAIYDESSNALRINLSGYTGGGGGSSITGLTSDDDFYYSNDVLYTPKIITSDLEVVDNLKFYPQITGASIGYNNTVTGSKSVSIGSDNKSTYAYAISIGHNNESKQYNTIAIGENNKSTYVYAISIGHNNESKQYNTIAIGENNYSGHERSVTIGYTNKCYYVNSVSLGYRNENHGRETNSFGSYNISQRDYTMLIGHNNTSDSNSSYQYIFGRDNSTYNGNYNLVNGIKNDIYGEKNFVYSSGSTLHGNDTTILGGVGSTITNTTGTTWINPRGTYSGYTDGDVIIDGDTYFKDKVTIGDNTNNVTLDSTKGKRYIGSTSVWKDMIGDVFSKRLNSTTGKVDYDWDNNAIKFQKGGSISTVNDRVQWNQEINHEFKVGSSITFSPHIHWFSTISGGNQQNYEFTLEYRLQRNGYEMATGWTSLTLEDGDNDKFTLSTDGTYNQISIFPDITVDCSISDTLQFRMARVDNNTGDMLVYFMDLHGEVDSDGSDDEYTKNY